MISAKKKAKVMLIDDDPRYIELLQFSLEGDGFEVLACTSPEHAVNAASKFMPDIILSDVSMPGMDGFRLALDFRAEPATTDTPIVFLTARGQQADLSAGHSVGAVEYFTKPFSMSQLSAKLRSITDLQARARSSV